MGTEKRGAGEWNIVLVQGKTWTRTVTSDDALDLSAYSTARMQIRKSYEDNVALLSLTESSGIDLTNAATGVIVFSITAAASVPLDFEEGVMDIELVNGAEVLDFAYGRVCFTKEVTR